MMRSPTLADLTPDFWTLRQSESHTQSAETVVRVWNFGLFLACGLTLCGGRGRGRGLGAGQLPVGPQGRTAWAAVVHPQPHRRALCARRLGGATLPGWVCTCVSTCRRSQRRAGLLGRHPVARLGAAAVGSPPLSYRRPHSDTASEAQGGAGELVESRPLDTKMPLRWLRRLASAVTRHRVMCPSRHLLGYRLPSGEPGAEMSLG